MTYDDEHNRRAPMTSQHSGLSGHLDQMGRHEGHQDAEGVLPVPGDPSGDHSTEPANDGTPLKILVVDRKGSFGSDIERAARSLDPMPKIVVSAHPTHVVEVVAMETPDVVLAAPEEMTSTGLRRLAQVHRAAPKCVIALTQSGTGPVISMTEAAACGASEVIAYPASTVRLRNALGRVIAAAEALRSERVVIREVVTEVPVHIPAPALHQAPPQAPPASAKVFTVTSPTGGCGKTFFATNLAAYLAGATGGRVLLVDLDLQFGEVSLALGLRPQRTISELINEESLIDAFPEYVVEHSAGYKVLSAPADPFAAELVGPREATQVLEAARSLYDYVVVDTPPSLNEVVLAAFDQSRYLVVMATMDVPSLRNLKVFLETIDRLKLPADDVSCVLNKAEPDNGIDLDELLRVYPGGFAAVLPYSKEVSRSLNVGQPVLMVDPRADISQKILEAGAKLVPASEIRNPTWMARPAGRTPWQGRRKDRHTQPAPAPVAPPVPQPQPAHRPSQPAAFTPPPPGYQPGPAYQTPPARAAVYQSPLPPTYAPAAPHAVYPPPPAAINTAGAEASRVGAQQAYEPRRELPPAYVPAPMPMPMHEAMPAGGPGSQHQQGWFSRLFSFTHRGTSHRGSTPGGGMGPAEVTPLRMVPPAMPASLPAMPAMLSDSISTMSPLAGRANTTQNRTGTGPNLVFTGSRGGTAPPSTRRTRPNEQPSASWKEPTR